MADYRSNKTCEEIDAILDNAVMQGSAEDSSDANTLSGLRKFVTEQSASSLIYAGTITAPHILSNGVTIGAIVDITQDFAHRFKMDVVTNKQYALSEKRVMGDGETLYIYPSDYAGCYFVMGDFDGNDTIFGLDASKGDWVVAQGNVWVKVATSHREIAGIEGEVTANKLAQKLSTPSEDNTNPLATTKDLDAKTDIVASQIFLEFIGDRGDFQVFSHKIGCEEHNRRVCQRLIENCFTDKMPNNEMFFVTINGLRDGVPYMETAILESQSSEIVRASFIKGTAQQGSSTAASIDILSTDVVNLRAYAESGDDLFYWKYYSVTVPSIDAIGSGGNESDVYVTEFTFEQVTKNGTAVNVSRAFVDAVYSKKIILVPYRTAYMVAYSAQAEIPEKITSVYLRFFFAGIDYISTLSGSTIPTGGTRTIQVRVETTTYISGTLSTINGVSLLGDRNIPLAGAIVVNGDTFTPDAKGVVDLGTIGGGGGNVSFIDNDSMQGLPFGYIGGYYRSYEFDGISNAEVNLGYIENYYIDTIVIAHNGVLYEESILGLKGNGKILGTVIVRVDDSYNLHVKQATPKKTTFGWRIYTGKTLMPDSWVDLANYYTKSEVNSAIATAITNTLNTPV